MHQPHYMVLHVILIPLKLSFGRGIEHLGPGIKQSRARWRHVILKGQGRDGDVFGYIYLEKRLEIEAQFQRTTNRKWYSNSNGNVIDDVTRRLNVSVLTLSGLWKWDGIEQTLYSCEHYLVCLTD